MKELLKHINPSIATNPTFLFLFTQYFIMSNPFDNISSESIIINDEALTELFIPQKLLHRKDQTQYIVSCLKPVIAGKTPRNIFLSGPTGTGKTSLMQWIFEELKEKTTNVKTAYVNCWKNTTTHSILSKIISDMNIGFTNPRKNSKSF